ncbi:MAG: DUF4335 domain-containing protein [Synechococcales bacterium]|nr:DUF4335 domain-containing protein [Synechococcales bacterium]
MAAANLIQRRYTPPTCTLEVNAQPSALERWTGKTTLKNLRFNLSFDDPRLSEDQYVTLRGDRTQLEALIDAVSSYVQDFLNQSSRLVSHLQPESEGGVATLAPPAVDDFLPIELQSTRRIFLKPKGLLSHTLVLGSLANEQSGNELTLSSTQLADLATALDEYSADIVTLPALAKAAWKPSPAMWTRVAAGALVVVGLGVATLRGFDRTIPTVANNQPPSSNDQRLALDPLPSPSGNPNSILNNPMDGTSTDGSMTGSDPSALSANPDASSPTDSNSTASTLPPPPPDTLPAPPPVPSPNAPSTIASAPTVTTIPEAAPIKPPKVPVIKPAPIPAPQPDSYPVAELPINPTDLSQGNTGAASSAKPSAARVAPKAAESLLKDDPQVDALRQQIQGKLQAKWQVPSGLSEDLEYQVTVDPDGGTEDLLPLGDNARKYIDRTGLSPKGEPFGSADPESKSRTWRILYKADGTVQVFPIQAP